MGLLRNILNLRITSRLCKASKKGRLEKVKLFVEKGANINGNDRKNPLIIAILNGKYGVAKYLIRNGADINAKRGYWTPIHAAVESGHFEIVKFLIQNGANVNALVGYERSTPLHIAAAKKGNSEIIRYLLENKPKYMKNSLGETPLQIARKNENHEKLQRIFIYI